MLSWLQDSGDIDRLIARGNYGRAVKLLEKELRKKPRSARLRLRLADVLSQAERGKEAVAILQPLVDEYAADGFVAKAIAVLKKMQRIDPEQQDEVARKLTQLVQQHGAGQEVQARAPGAPALVTPEIDTEEVTPMDEDRPPPETSELVLPENWFPQTAKERRDFNWSPLFNDFSRGELEAVIGGLRLLIKHPGAIVFTQDEPGDSLFILSSGAVRVYRRDGAGHNHQIAVLEEGAFFGTASVLAGEPRSATVTAASDCELLELDKTTFDRIAEHRPRVRQLVATFHTDAKAQGRVPA